MKTTYLKPVLDLAATGAKILAVPMDDLVVTSLVETVIDDETEEELSA